MQTAIRIAAADQHDAATLAALEADARLAIVDSRGGAALLAEQPAVRNWLELLSGSGTLVWLAEIDGVPVGYLELELPGQRGIGLVRQVYVDAGAREIGFGDWMLAAAIEATTDAGGTSIESFALPGDRETKNLFERSGMTARKIIVSKRL